MQAGSGVRFGSSFPPLGARYPAPPGLTPALGGGKLAWGLTGIVYIVLSGVPKPMGVGHRRFLAGSSTVSRASKRGSRVCSISVESWCSVLGTMRVPSRPPTPPRAPRMPQDRPTLSGGSGATVSGRCVGGSRGGVRAGFKQDLLCYFETATSLNSAKAQLSWALVNLMNVPRQV